MGLGFAGAGIEAVAGDSGGEGFEFWGSGLELSEWISCGGFRKSNEPLNYQTLKPAAQLKGPPAIVTRPKD